MAPTKWGAPPAFTALSNWSIPVGAGYYGNKKNASGSFSISRKAVDLMVQHKATAWQIGAYLTLARHTNSDNKFSTASLKAIYNSTGASNNRGGTGERIVKEL